MAYDPRKHVIQNRRFFARVHSVRAVGSKAATKEGNLYLYDTIGDGWFGGISPQAIVDSLKDMDDVKVLNIYINSPGGNVFDANAIYENIKRHKAKKIVYVDGLAASAASVLAMVGDEIHMSSGGMMMIHDPWSMAIGSKKDMLDAAEMLDKVRDTLIDRYAARTKQSKKQISDWMEAETWMDAKEAEERGFVDDITEDAAEEDKEANGALAFLDNYRNTPANLRAKARDPRTLLAHMDMKIAALGVTPPKGPAKPPKAAEPVTPDPEDSDPEDPEEGPEFICKCEATKFECGCCADCSSHGTSSKNRRASPTQQTGQPVK
jgi:ATP-dependent Clp protease protease subunit